MAAAAGLGHGAAGAESGNSEDCAGNVDCGDWNGQTLSVSDIAPEAFDAGRVVLNVAPGGADYTVAYVTADDESMRVTGAYDFKSRLAQ